MLTIRRFFPSSVFGLLMLNCPINKENYKLSVTHWNLYLFFADYSIIFTGPSSGKNSFCSMSCQISSWPAPLSVSLSGGPGHPREGAVCQCDKMVRSCPALPWCPAPPSPHNGTEEQNLHQQAPLILDHSWITTTFRTRTALSLTTSSSLIKVSRPGSLPGLFRPGHICLNKLEYKNPKYFSVNPN